MALLAILGGAAMAAFLKPRTIGISVSAVGLLVFAGALSSNLARHHPVDCGCFRTQAGARSADERLADMRWAILRDLGLLALAAQVLAAAPRRDGAAE